jgi:hypothetical protein
LFTKIHPGSKTKEKAGKPSRNFTESAKGFSLWKGSQHTIHASGHHFIRLSSNKALRNIQSGIEAVKNRLKQFMNG